MPNPHRRNIRRGHGGRRFNSSQSNNYASTSQNTDNVESESGENPFKHPKHLKGKEIGLFYRDRARKRKEEQGEDPEKKAFPLFIASGFSPPNRIPPIELSQTHKNNIQRLLDSKTDLEFRSELLGGSNIQREFLRKISESYEDKLSKINVQCYTGANPTIDEKYHSEFITKKDSNLAYKIMDKSRQRLPAYNKKEEILKLINDHQVVLISGETGCGKTTQVSQFILEDCLLNGRASMCKIVCTQPRRISAISVAERVAQERAEKLGQSVGYQIRLESQLPNQYASILFATTGVILTQMISDPFLSIVTHLIIDEIHERDISSDFLLTLCKMIIEKRKDIKLILMSATLNAEHFSKYFNNCPHINIPGFTYPVKEYYLEDVIAFTNFTFEEKDKNGPKRKRERFSKESEGIDFYTQMMGPHVRRLETQRLYSKHVCQELKKSASEQLNITLIYELLCYICRTQPDGAILVFLPGYADISGLIRLCEQSGRFPVNNFAIYPLHSQMPTLQQKEIFNKPRAGIRKIIVATNIAETSITIDDVVYVVDCGKMKQKNYNNNDNVLVPEWVSLANAAQRAGRAGRVQPGVCYHLYSKAREMVLEKYQTPEILRTRLEETILRLKIMQLGKAHSFLQKCLNPPPDPTVIDSIQFLQNINALDSNENLTPLGYHLAKLPVHPQMGKMILLGAMFGCLDPVLSIAAALGFKDPFVRPMGKEKHAEEMKYLLSDDVKSDHYLLHKAISRYRELKHNYFEAKKFCHTYFLSQNTLETLMDMRKQFVQYLYDMKFVSSLDPMAQEVNVNSLNISLVKAVICAGLYPNIGYIRTKVRRIVHLITTMDCKKPKLHPSSVLNNDKSYLQSLLVYFTRIQSSCLYLHDVTLVHPLPVLFFGPNAEKFTVADGRTAIVIDNKINIKCDSTTADLILQLRERLNVLLEYKVSNPDVIDWRIKDSQTTTLSAIIELITSEDIGELMGKFDVDGEEDDDDCQSSDY